MNRPWPPGFDPERLNGRIFVLTGAGISVESGLPTFRGAGGLYEGRRVEDLATPEGFARDPEFVWRWYSARIAQVLAAEPNPGHLALAQWARRASSFTLVSSNVDDLHERAGSEVFKLHGAILEARDPGSGEIHRITEPPSQPPRSLSGGLLRPNVVWFGEQPSLPALSAAMTALAAADLMVEVGTSGQVQYGLTDMALRRGCPVIRINPEAGPSRGSLVHWAEPASPALRWLADQAEALSP